jgi:hypothetical protein
VGALKCVRASCDSQVDEIRQVLQALEGEQKDRNRCVKPCASFTRVRLANKMKDALKLDERSEQMDGRTRVEWLALLLSRRLRHCGSTLRYLVSRAEGQAGNRVLYRMRDHASRICIAY